MEKKSTLKHNLSKISSYIISKKKYITHQINLKYKQKNKLKYFKHKKNGKNNRGSSNNIKYKTN